MIVLYWSSSIDTLIAIAGVFLYLGLWHSETYLAALFPFVGPCQGSIQSVSVIPYLGEKNEVYACQHFVGLVRLLMP